MAGQKRPIASHAGYYLKAVRKMNTFVCEVCYKEELQAHPILRTDGTPAWYLAMAELAKEQGWLMMPVNGKREGVFFRDFEVVGPACAATRASARR